MALRQESIEPEPTSKSHRPRPNVSERTSQVGTADRRAVTDLDRAWARRGRDRDLLALQRVIGNRAVSQLLDRGQRRPMSGSRALLHGASTERLQRLEITTANRKEVETLRKRYVTANGSEKGWKELVSGAKNMAALRAAVAKLEAPEEEGDDTEKAKVDRHGTKHLRNKKGTTKRDMLAKSKTQPATFYPSVNYEDLLQRVVRVAEESGSQYVDVGEGIGVDKGEETTTVEVYGGPEVGYHIRPKSQNYIKGLKNKSIPTLNGRQSGGSEKDVEDVEPSKGEKEETEKGEKEETEKGEHEVEPTEGEKEDEGTKTVSETEGSSSQPTKDKKKQDGVPAQIEGVGQVVNVSGRGMNCLIRALYRAIGQNIADDQLLIIRNHLRQQNVAEQGAMLDVVGAAGAVLISYLVQQGVIAANRGILVYTPDHMDNPHQIINGPNPISLWLSGNHFRAIV